MKMRNRKNIIILTLLTFILIISNRIFSQENYNQNLSVNLIDKDLNFPILKILKIPEIFLKNSINVYYVNNDISYFRDEDINIYSNLTNKNGLDYAFLTIYSKNNENQDLKITCQIPKVNEFRFVNSKSMKDVFDFVIQTRENNTNEIILNKIRNGNNIIDFDVSYYDDRDGTHIKEYDITVKNESLYDQNFWRTSTEIVLLNGIGMANYWMTKEENIEDWEYQPNKSGFKKKITDGWSFDTNSFRTNTVGHTYAGMMYYQTARSNGYGYLFSTLWTFAGSLLWEYAGEFREQVSINDMIFTTTGGVLIGEAFRQCSIYLENRIGKSILGGILVFVIDPMRIINRKIDQYLVSNFKVNIQFLHPTHIAFKKIPR